MWKPWEWASVSQAAALANARVAATELSRRAGRARGRRALPHRASRAELQSTDVRTPGGRITFSP